ncbi:MAG TPA: ATP-binding protein [Patescibacteria group bacterium]|nr:ATP-binding protein [Patescibacteria group bacterium]
MGTRLPLLSKAVNVAVVAMGALVLAGWASGFRPLMHLFPTLVVMNPVTALGLMLAGWCFLVLDHRASRGPKAHDTLTLAIAAAITLLGLLRLLDCFFGLDLELDQLLFRSKLSVGGSYPPSEMAPNTALNFLLCGVALLLFDVHTRHGFYLSHGFILVAAWVALLAIIGYTYRVLLFYRLGSGLPMALDTAVAFALFCTGFVTARPERGVLSIVTSRTTGGAMARRLLPMAVLIPWGLGAMLLVSEQAGYFGKEFAVSLFAVASIILFTFLLWWNAKLLYQVDIKRAGAEDQLREASANLQRSNTDLQQFAYLASHDLFEPLRMVTSYLQLLEHRYTPKLDQQGREFVTFAIDGAKRMEALIHDLLEYSRVEIRGRPFQSTDCEEVFAAAVANLKVAIEESGATIAHEQLPTVMADRVQLTQLFQNLIGNAIKFRGERKPQVSLHVQRRDQEWLFVVRDNGIGINPKDFARIFIIFQRLHTRQEYAGTGMGLAICKKIVERHGGRIWGESVPGQGSSFFFTLPVMT